MTDIEVLDGPRGAASGHRVDVSRGGHDGRVSSEWSSRPDDERYLRHHFRFIVSPEAVAELSDLHTFTKDLMATAASGLGTELDWIAVDHWNTEHPHIYVLLRGRTDGGEDLVIARDYIGSGLRGRACERATLELGPRSALEIRSGLGREVQADRWTSLDRTLQRDAVDTVVDLRPRLGKPPDETAPLRICRGSTSDTAVSAV